MTAASPSVSVIIPCFNGERFLAQAIGSVLNQTARPNQIIVVDDGSQDGSVAAVRGFGDQIILLQQANAGAAAARNLGVSHATSELLAFLDADDWWVSDCLEHQVACLAQHKADLVFGAVTQVDAEGRPLGPPMTGRMFSSILMRKAAFDRVGPLDESLKTAELIDWMARAEGFGLTMASHSHMTYFRRVHGGNLMLNTPGQAADRFTVLRNALHRKRQAGA